MTDERLRNAVEAALFAAGKPLGVEDLLNVFAESERPAERADLRAALAELVEHWRPRGLELVEVASGWRFQVRREYSGHLARLWSDKPPRYSRALLETLAIIAYRQPVTRGEIEDIRGVAVSPSILKTLHEREWIRALGHKEIPGRPELLGTTRQFLDDLGLASLESLPPLAEIRDLDAMPDDLFPETRQAGLPAVAHGQAAPADDAAEPATDDRADAEPVAGPGSDTSDGGPAPLAHADGPEEPADAARAPQGAAATASDDGDAADEQPMQAPGDDGSTDAPAGDDEAVPPATGSGDGSHQADDGSAEDDEEVRREPPPENTP